MLNSIHYANDRQQREAVIKTIGYGKTIEEFTVEYDGRLQKHILSNTGIITVTNIEKTKIITKKIARPTQIKKLYALKNRVAPEDLLELAYEHTKNGYCNM